MAAPVRRWRRLARISDLYEFRNALAHANGQFRALTPGKSKALDALLSRYPTNEVEQGYFIPSAEYVAAAFGDVDASLRDLVHRVRGGPAVRIEEQGLTLR